MGFNEPLFLGIVMKVCCWFQLRKKGSRVGMSFALIDIGLAIKLKSWWLKLLAWTDSVTSTPNVWKGSQWRGGHCDPEVLQVIGSPEQPPQDPWKEQRPEPRPRSGQELATWETVWFPLSSKFNRMDLFYFISERKNNLGKHIEFKSLLFRTTAHQYQGLHPSGQRKGYIFNII